MGGHLPCRRSEPVGTRKAERQAPNPISARQTRNQGSCWKCIFMTFIAIIITVHRDVILFSSDIQSIISAAERACAVHLKRMGRQSRSKLHKGRRTLQALLALCKYCNPSWLPGGCARSSCERTCVHKGVRENRNKGWRWSRAACHGLQEPGPCWSGEAGSQARPDSPAQMQPWYEQGGRGAVMEALHQPRAGLTPALTACTARLRHAVTAVHNHTGVSANPLGQSTLS